MQRVPYHGLSLLHIWLFLRVLIVPPRRYRTATLLRRVDVTHISWMPEQDLADRVILHKLYYLQPSICEVLQLPK